MLARTLLQVGHHLLSIPANVEQARDCRQSGPEAAAIADQFRITIFIDGDNTEAAIVMDDSLRRTKCGKLLFDRPFDQT